MTFQMLPHLHILLRAGCACVRSHLCPDCTMLLHPYNSSCTRLKVSLPRTLCAQIILLSLQERKAAEKVKRDGMAHEMARYDKGSMFLNLITSKKSKPEPEPEPLGQPLQVDPPYVQHATAPARQIMEAPSICGLELAAHHQGSICCLSIQVASATCMRVLWEQRCSLVCACA